MNGQVSITLVTDDVPSQQTRDRLRHILQTYNVEPWLFTRAVQIDARSIPHSHPVLTLHARHLGRDDLLLATFLHEQLHWYLIATEPAAVERAFEELRARFPDAPVGPPDGAEDEESTYLHLIVNLLEGRAVGSVLGEAAATDVLEYWATDHYRWIYRTVIDHADEIGEILDRSGLRGPTR